MKHITISLPDNSSVSLDVINAMLQARSPIGAKVRYTKLHPIDELRDYINTNIEMVQTGAVELLTTIDPHIQWSGVLDVKLTNCTRYNGSEIGLVVGGRDLTDELDDRPSDSDCFDMWVRQVSGSMLEDLGGLVLLMLFGVKIPNSIQQSLVDGTLVVKGVQNPLEIFTDYPSFVSKLLSGDDIAKYKYRVREDDLSS